MVLAVTRRISTDAPNLPAGRKANVKRPTLILSVFLCLAATQIAQGLTIERPLDSGAIDLASTTVVGSLITVGPPTTFWNGLLTVPKWEYWWVYFKMTDVDLATTYQFRIDAPKMFGTDTYREERTAPIRAWFTVTTGSTGSGSTTV